MLYKNYQNLNLSVLGMGTMRLPTLGDDSQIDEDATAEMIAYAMENGINYYDTAWGYHDGRSELVVGKCLSKYPRDSFFLADKFPGYDLSNMNKVEEIFEAQLIKCGVEYFDFYMFHNVCEMNINEYLDRSYRIFDYLMEQKKNGRIRHLGFSAHGSCEVMQRFLEAYGEHMEFCQIQLNYLDYEFQNAKGKIELLNKYNIPVWVMEPVRGGKLASLSDKDTATLASLRPNEKTVAWAFRFLQSVPEVTVTLSGMSNFEQLKENISTMSEYKPLTNDELDTILGIADDMVKKIAISCTACHYCTTKCPQQLNIPNLIELYNEHCFTGGGFLAPMALQAVPTDKHPDACIGCRSCEAVCPQQIKIADIMEDFVKKLKQ